MSSTRTRPRADIPRLALNVSETAAAVGRSEEFVAEHIFPECRVVRRGRVKLLAVTELQRWLDENSHRWDEAA